MNYIYSITGDTLNGQLYSPTLEEAINASAIVETLNRIDTTGDELSIVFDVAITTGDKTLLDGLVAAHDGQAPAKTATPQIVQLSSTDEVGVPKVVVDKPSGNFDTIITHNFCDNTTWTATNNSTWELIPAAGKVINVDRAEVQFQHDVSIAPTEMYLDYHAYVAPGVTAVAQRITFASMYDIFNLANEHYHAPALPEISLGISTCVFNYANKLRFYGTEQLGSLYKLVISTQNNDEVTGSFSTVGFITSEQDI